MNNSAQICHYTSIKGFKSIVENGKLWATNVSFLNDNKEYSHIFDLFDNELSRVEIEFNSSSNKNSFFFQHVKECINSIRDMGQEHYYTTSFSKNADQLSQWRAYGCLGIIFNKKKLESSIVDMTEELIEFRDCNYEEELLSLEIYDDIKRLYKKFCEKHGTKGRDVIDELIVELQLDMYYKSCFYKNSGFHEEAEVRMSCATPDKIKFRSNGKYLIPYVDLDFSKDAIESIVIGPCIDSARMKKSIEMFLHHHFAQNLPQIIESKVPYRNW